MMIFFRRSVSRLLFLCLFLNLACSNNESSLAILKKAITKILVDLNIDNRVFIEDMKIEEANDLLIIEVVFGKPYMAHPVQQEVLFSYILHLLPLNTKWNAIDIIYYLDKEKYSNPKIISYDAAKLLKVNTAYEHPMLLEMVAYCMRNFNTTDPFVLDKSIQYVNDAIPEKTIAKDFFELLALFNKECNRSSPDHLATNTLILTYQLRKEFSEQKEYQNVVKLLAELWTFCCSDGIESASKQYFSAPELLFPCS